MERRDRLSVQRRHSPAPRRHKSEEEVAVLLLNPASLSVFRPNLESHVSICIFVLDFCTLHCVQADHLAMLHDGKDENKRRSKRGGRKKNGQ